ncbi:MAG: cyclopropane-fatty-acyl-phospholipid synthase family protein [Pseudomonadota bacterium]
MKPATLTDNKLALPSTANLSSQLVKRLLERIRAGIDTGSLTIRLPDNSEMTIVGPLNSKPVARIDIQDLKALRRLFLHGDLGFAEGYLAGEWSTPDLTALLRLGLENEDKLNGAVRKRSGIRWLARLKHLLNANSKRQAKKNIAYHYDLGNEFYGQWLDSSMTYSSAVFPNSADEPVSDLETAQRMKYAHIAKSLNISERHKILEIGCGWGGFMEHIVENAGASVTGVSISKEQCRYASRRLSQLEGGERAEVLFKDYRELTGQYDRIASIEMFEAVGQQYWATYANKLKELLKPDGVACLQVITISGDRFERYSKSADFIQRYIFPGGMLPSENSLAEVMQQAGLRVTDTFRFGPHYAETLRRWRENFDTAWPEIVALGFDERFQRMWHYYLAYCEVGFDHGATDVIQIRLEHDL